MQICEQGWEYLNGKCYKLVIETKTFEEAKENCESLGAKLAEPQSPCESDLLHYYLQITRSKDETKKHAWIGINDIDTEGTFVFASSNQGLPYTYWNPTEPSNGNGNGEDCVHLYYEKENGEWNDIPCNYQALSICEKPHFLVYRA